MLLDAATAKASAGHAMAGSGSSTVPVRAVAPVELSVIVPTFNERANLDELIGRIGAALPDVAWEAIVVDDDSPDGTHAHARALSARDGRVRIIRRVGRRGLSSACIEGMLSCSAPYLAVMDADLQHDPALLPAMLRLLREDRTDLVVASRYIAGGATGAWAKHRALLSRVATRITRKVARLQLSDPMSGYFALHRQVVDDSARRLSGLGFKILLDLVLSAGRPLRIAELPFVFGVRTRGESKLSVSVAWECALLLVDKTVGRYIPARFAAFACIGAFGVGVHFLVLSVLYLLAGVEFLAAQIAATCVAIVANFSVNNLLTYSDRSLKGPAWWGGLLSFAAICGFGALANIGVSDYLFGHHARWPVAALAGIAASAVWNYAVSARYTWRSGRRPA
ncbi:MAG: glycosyltransferase family 2 protein [Pseudoxanthomonas sp.]